MSPVIGSVLMIALVVLLAAVLASIALDTEDRLREPGIVGAFGHDYVPSGADNTADRPYVEITNSAGRTVDGDNVVIRDESGNRLTWADVWTGGPEVKAGEQVHIDGFGSDSALDPICEGGQTYYVILLNDEDETLSVDEWTVPTDPDLPVGSPSDADGDGIPDWC